MKNLNSDFTIKIASRKSDLARMQAQSVRDVIQKKFPGIKVELHYRSSLGDQNQNDPLWQMPEKGVFTEDFYQDLIDEKMDAVVHSWKDLPTQKKELTHIVATLTRADQRDLFLMREDRWSQVVESKKIKILTSSPRRSYNLKDFFNQYLPCSIQECSFWPVRGNILTRMKKLFEQDVDGLIVAKAAIDRLLSVDALEYDEGQTEILELLKKTRWMALPLSLNPTAAAQGALAIEIKNESKKSSILKDVFAKLNDKKTFELVEKERAILASYGGGCHQKIGISLRATEFGYAQYLRGLTDSGEVLKRQSLNHQESKQKPALNVTHIWPEPDAEANLFEREKLDSPLQAPEKLEYVWASKADAISAKLAKKINSKTYVWCAGLETAKKLAQMGIWVHGTNESLGEAEPTLIELLVASKQAATLAEFKTLKNTIKVAWHKFTHETAQEYVDTQTQFQNITASYKILPKKGLKEELENEIKNKTHFYWASGSQFALMLELFPNILKSQHGCGPGSSFKFIYKKLKEHNLENNLAMYMNKQDWYEKILPDIK